MEDIRQRISNLTLKLQSQTQLPFWALANQRVIYSIAVGEKTEWGPRTKILFHIMRVAYKINATDLVLFCVGLYRVLFIWWKIKKGTLRMRTLNKFQRIFAGFGAAAEEHLYTDFINQSQASSLRINWVSYKGMSELGCPSLVSVLVGLVRNSIGHSAKVKNALFEVSSNAVDFLTVSALNVGAYAFYRSYWHMAKKIGVSEVTFLVPDIIAFSSIDEDIKSIFLQHGLLALSILIPKFHRIDVLTTDEYEYFTASLKNIPIFKKPQKIMKNKIKDNFLMVLSLNIFSEEELLSLEKIIQWAKTNRLQIILRPTPHEIKEKLDEVYKRFPDTLIDDINVTLDASLEKWRPKLVVSSGSTGLATALDHECIPVSLWNPEFNDIRWNNMIYPMKKRVLFWPRDEAILGNAMQSESVFYFKLIDQLRTNV